MYKRPIKTSLILCPFWHTEAPPLGISYLGSYLRSKEYETYYGRFKGDLEGFLQMAEKAWGMNIKHDKEKKALTILGKETAECFCPFVQEDKMSPDFCNCSLGWQQHTFSTLIGKPVKVGIIQSVLRGGKSCDFLVDYS